MIRNFWWGQKGEEKKMAWLSWDKLCEPKERGGMGFKRLLQFNLALLAKQGWRLQTCQNSLLYHVLKAKYFPSCDFLHATIGNNPSYTWRSIFATKTIVEKGIRWRVGNGIDIWVWGDRWLPRASSYEVISPRLFLHQDTKVSEFICQDSCCWKEDIIKQIFLPVDVEAILSIPISSKLPEDRLIWVDTTNGGFTVRSVYKVAMILYQSGDVATSSSNSQQRSFWNKIWYLPVPHKVRHFAWCACREILPTKENLQVRRILLDSTCEECGLAPETLGHLFWSCSRAQQIWSYTKLPSSLRSGQFYSFYDLLWFLLMIESFDEEKIALVVTVAWALWSNRNDVRHGGVRKNPEALVRWVTHYLMEYTAAMGMVVPVTGDVTILWNPLPPAMLKINVDGAISKRQNRVSVGSVIRDDTGRVVVAMSRSISVPLGPLEVEAKAFEAGLQLARDLGYQDVILGGDSLILVRALCGLSLPPSTIDSLVVGMQYLCFEFHMVYVSHVRRQGNKPAHILAKYALSLNESVVWIEENPCCIEQALIQDFIFVSDV